MNFIPWERDEGERGGAVQRDVTKELAALFSFAGQRFSNVLFRLELSRQTLRLRQVDFVKTSMRA